MDCTTRVIHGGTAQGDAVDRASCAHDPFSLVIFGASGDLAKRKLLPALFQLEKDGLLPRDFAVVGFSRTAMTDLEYRASVSASLAEQGLTPGPESRLLDSLHYVPGDNGNPASFARLAAKLSELEASRGLPGNRLYYLSVGPEFFATIVQQLAEQRMIRDRSDPLWTRVIIEKPFGRDLASARTLSAQVTTHLDESQLYRIDHYLGKETVQNLFGFRFGNSIFEPLFNQKYVENIQITVAEQLGMENKRGGYYDNAGALRDMVQNHMLQLVSLIAMEPPSSLDGQALRDEKVKVLRAIDPMSLGEVAKNTVRGQYGVGQQVKAYRAESGVDPQSTTESYVAIKLSVDNWRWAGVPFFLRTGKRLRQRVSEIAVTFRQPPMHLFRELAEPEKPQARPRSNVLLLRIQPDEAIGLTFAAKRPGMKMQLDDVRMDFSYSAFQKRSPEAYERLLLDALRGDASLFTRSDEVEHAWRFINTIQEGWAQLPAPSFPNYAPFSDGPEEANRLFEGRSGGFRSLASDE